MGIWCVIVSKCKECYQECDWRDDVPRDHPEPVWIDTQHRVDVVCKSRVT